jgi:predicted lipoprotein with Yx(FWY)xxD motif
MTPGKPSRGTSRQGWAAALALLLVAAVGTAAAAAAVHARGTAKVAAIVKLRKTALGTVLVDARGRTLYMYTVDKGGMSACYAGCAAAWPPLLAKTAKPAAVAGVRKALLGTTRRRDGALQVTYAHHPLYTFAFDKRAGQLNGQRYGGRWYVLAATGAVIRTAVPKPAATATTPSAPTTTPADTTTSAGGGGWG